MKMRSLTVSWMYRKRVGRFATIFPKLQLAGRWFHQAGFHPGDQVEVQVKPGKITITLKPPMHEN